MNRIISAFIKPKMTRRIVMVIIAQIIMGLAVNILRLAHLGTDPWSAMMLALTAKTTLSYGNFCAIVNVFLFVIEIILGRKYIGFGTIANCFLLGYCVDFWSWIVTLIQKSISITPESLIMRIIVCLIAIVILAFSLSLYQCADIGTSPYDSFPLILKDRTPVPFFAGRICLDAISVIICLIAHGVVGLATVLIVFGLGPVAGFFNRLCCEKMVE